MKIYDISTPLYSGMPVYPGDPPVMIEPALDLEKGDPANVARMSMSTHSGTHIDAPRHVADRGITVDNICLSVLTGRALVVEIGGTKKIGRKELEPLPVKGEERLLLKTDNSLLWGRPRFSVDFAGLTDDGADYLAGIGIRLVGIDYLSVEAFTGDGTVHRTLLEHGIIILEGLNLDGIQGGAYELICLPLKVRAGDGAPARAILRRRDEGAGIAAADPHTTRWPLA